MSDAIVSPGGVPNSNVPLYPTFFSIANVALLPGQPVTPLTGGNAGQMGKALASAAQTSISPGLAAAGALATQRVPVQFAGFLALTDAEWNAVITDATPAGLTPSAFYWVSDATAGGITRVRPTTNGHFAVPVGISISDTLMLVLPGAPVSLPSS